MLHASDNKTHRTILSLHYFLYFGVFGIVLPYFNLYLDHMGFDGIQIGIIAGIRSAAIVFMPLLWGVLADRTHKRKSIFVLCNICSTALFALYFLSTDFLPILGITILYSLFYAPIISFVEAFSMEILGSNRNQYGHVRAWGTMAFVATALIMGKVVEAWGVPIILALILCGSAIQALVSTRMPAPNPSLPDKESAAKYFFTKKVILFQLCAFLMLASHGTYYGFFSIYLEKAGYSSTFIGFAWALASAAELGVMLNSGRILGRFHPRRILFFSLCVAALRWGLMAWTLSPIALCAVQILHAATYGSFHIASIVYMEQLIPPRARTAGQAVNNSMTYGLGMMVGLFLSGYLFERLGGGMAFAASGAMAVLGAILFALGSARPTIDKSHIC
ncbi:MAG: MFS transporter [Desulfatibacillum sp.]|nr:MFS transporter [Desulfatibacillum sp.]